MQFLLKFVFVGVCLISQDAAGRWFRLPFKKKGDDWPRCALCDNLGCKIGAVEDDDLSGICFKCIPQSFSRKVSLDPNRLWQALSASSTRLKNAHILYQSTDLKWDGEVTHRRSLSSEFTEDTFSQCNFQTDLNTEPGDDLVEIYHLFFGTVRKGANEIDLGSSFTRYADGEARDDSTLTAPEAIITTEADFKDYHGEYAYWTLHTKLKKTRKQIEQTPNDFAIEAVLPGEGEQHLLEKKNPPYALLKFQTSRGDAKKKKDTLVRHHFGWIVYCKRVPEMDGLMLIPNFENVQKFMVNQLRDSIPGDDYRSVAMRERDRGEWIRRAVEKFTALLDSIEGIEEDDHHKGETLRTGQRRIRDNCKHSATTLFDLYARKNGG